MLVFYIFTFNAKMNMNVPAITLLEKERADLKSHKFHNLLHS